MSIHIMVDSTANLPADMLAAHDNLHVVPLKLVLGKAEWQEPELAAPELFRLVKAQGVHPRTSQPSPGDFAAAFASAGETCPIIMICLAGGLSGTADSARMAARECRGREIYVIDSGTGAIGVMMLAKAALAMAAAGEQAGVVAERLEHMAAATRTLFIVDSLDYLRKGGRIGGAAALVGQILQIKPILMLQDAKVQVLDKVRTRSRAIARMLAELPAADSLAYIGVVYGEEPAAVEAMLAALRQSYPDTPVVQAALGSVLAAHLGPGVVGLIYQSKV